MAQAPKAETVSNLIGAKGSSTQQQQQQQARGGKNLGSNNPHNPKYKAPPGQKSGKMKSSGKTDPHPSVIPESHRDDRVAQVVDKFHEQPGAVEVMRARDVPDTKVRQKGKPVAGDAYSQVSPEKGTQRDSKMERETEKFAKQDGIAQKMGEKDLITAAQPRGKAKSVHSAEAHPDIVAKVLDKANHLQHEVDKLSSKDGALSKIGLHDRHATCRRGVVDGRGPLQHDRKTTSQLLNPGPGAHVVVKRRAHAGTVREVYEEAYASQERLRHEAQEAQTAAYEFLSKFSESEAKPQHPSLKQVPHDHNKGYGFTLESQPVQGFPGMGTQSRDRPRGARHCSGPKAEEKMHQPSEVKSSRFVRTLSSDHLTACLSHPDHRPFSAKAEHKVVHHQRKSARDSADAPEWWHSAERRRQDAADAEKHPSPSRVVAAGAAATAPARPASASSPSWWPSAQSAKPSPASPPAPSSAPSPAAAPAAEAGN